jgi:hypothetical protein
MKNHAQFTPRQAAHRDLCSLIAQLSGRSRRAQRALLEAELVRALERAYEFQLRCAELGTIVAAQKDKLLQAGVDVALAQGAARKRIHELRQEIFALVERCRAFERACEDVLATTADAVAVAPPPLVPSPVAPTSAARADNDPPTERSPRPTVRPEEAS